MTRTTHNVWLHRYAVLVALATLFLVGLGGVVTTKGVGMAVPDWPTTYGDHMFLFPYSKWIAGVFHEHSHRYVASIVGILTGLLALWIWVRHSPGRARWWGVIAVVGGLALVGVRNPIVFMAVGAASLVFIAYAVSRMGRDPNRLRWLGLIAFALVIVQGVLGGMRVLFDTHGLGTELGIFHAAVAQLFFLLIGSIALITSRWWTEGNGIAASVETPALRRWFVAITVLIFAQLLLGAGMRHQHAGLAVPDFPLAYGKLWPATDPASINQYNAQRLEAAGEQPITAAHVIVHMLHRIMAFVLLAAIGLVTWAAWRRTSSGSPVRRLTGAWLALVVLQAVLGMATIWSQRKVDITTAHVAVGAVTFLLGWLLVLVTGRGGAPKAALETARLGVNAAGLKHA